MKKPTKVLCPVCDTYSYSLESIANNYYRCSSCGMVFRHNTLGDNLEETMDDEE